MGPRHFSRGIKPIISASSRLATLQWGRGISAAESRGRLRHAPRCHCASMGPRHFSRGIPLRHAILTYALSKASMGPRHFSRGIHHHRRQHPPAAGASMGPRHFSRGIRKRSRRYRWRGRLQWGRGISAAESLARMKSPYALLMLQWGRGISAAESCWVNPVVPTT